MSQFLSWILGAGVVLGVGLRPPGEQVAAFLTSGGGVWVMHFVSTSIVFKKQGKFLKDTSVLWDVSLQQEINGCQLVVQ